MDWDDLRYLLAVHHTGSIAGAARELGVTKATASRRLAALEESLGTPLVERTPRGLQINAAGREALDAAEGIAERLSTLADRVATASEKQPHGVVRVTAPPWLAERCLVPALRELRSSHPAVEVQLDNTHALVNLAQREADLAIRNVRPTQKSLVSRKVGEIGGCVYASQLYLERRGAPRSRAEAAGHDVLVYETLGGMPGFEWLREPSTGGRIAFRANDPVALVGAATAGLGLTAVPCLLADAEPTLRRVDALGFERCDLYLVTPEAVRSAARVRVVADFLVETLKRHRDAMRG